MYVFVAFWKREISAMLKDTSRIPDPQLAIEVQAVGTI